MGASHAADDGAHEHVFLSEGHDENARRTRWVVALTAAMMVGEIIAGHLTGSMALLADGFHMATHAGALSVAAAAYSYARKHAHDPAFSFGTGKVGDLAGFASALILGLVAIWIGVESAMRFFMPSPVAFAEATVIATTGLAVNIASAALLSGGHHDGHDHHHHEHDHHHHHASDNNLRAAYIHVLADALTSILAIVALLCGRYLGWTWLDPAMGLVGAVVIARWSWMLLQDTAAVLLDRTEEDVSLKIRDIVEGAGGAKLADLHVWRIGPGARAAIVSITADDSMSGDKIRREVLSLHDLAHVTIECRSSAGAAA
jgi:cation diffusion facilitator family transporter